MPDGPSFVQPPGPRLKRDPTGVAQGPFFTDASRDRFSGREPLELFSDGHLQEGKHAQITIDSVSVLARVWNRDVVKDPCAFATIVEADGIFAIGQPGHNSASEQALQVDDPVE